MHSDNRLEHNWLVCRIGNQYMSQRLAAFSGIVMGIGCGERPLEVDILQYADRYTGCDRSHTLHDLQADVVIDANRDLPFVNDSLDRIISLEVLEHLAEPDVMLAKAFRILKPSGESTLSKPFQWWVHEEPWSYQRFTRHGLEYHLHKAGFTDILITPRSGFWTMWLLKLNYQLKRLSRGPSPIRTLMTACLIPIWRVNQIIVPWLDRLWPNGCETQGYFATARNP